MLAIELLKSIKQESPAKAGHQRINKKSKPTSHRYNPLPLLPSDPGGVQEELVVPICVAKVSTFFRKKNIMPFFIYFFYNCYFFSKLLIIII